MQIKVRPLHDKILVERVEQETKTAGGIIIPETAQEKPMQGNVVAVGNGIRDEAGKVHPLDVKVGDRVLFAKWGGNEIKIDSKEFLVLKESDVLAVLEK